MYVQAGRLQRWSQTLSLPHSCPWVPFSPVAGTWTYEPLRPQPYCSCWHRPSHTQSWLGFPWSHSWHPLCNFTYSLSCPAWSSVAFTTSLAHLHLLQWLPNGQRHAPRLQLLNSNPIHTCAHRLESLHPGKTKEFKKKTGQIMLQVQGAARQVKEMTGHVSCKKIEQECRRNRRQDHKKWKKINKKERATGTGKILLYCHFYLCLSLCWIHLGSIFRHLLTLSGKLQDGTVWACRQKRKPTGQQNCRGHRHAYAIPDRLRREAGSLISFYRVFF